MSSNIENSGNGADFDPEKMNGVYLLSIESIYDGYSVKGGNAHTLVDDVRVNDRYIGITERIEIEVDDYELTETNSLGKLELNLIIHEGEDRHRLMEDIRRIQALRGDDWDHENLLIGWDNDE